MESIPAEVYNSLSGNTTCLQHRKTLFATTLRNLVKVSTGLGPISK
jgi:hypothetical protein